MRIVSFLPTATEMLYALGLGKSVVGRSQHCVWPQEVRRKPVVVSSHVKKVAKQDSLAIHKAVIKLRDQGAHQFDIDVAALRRLKPDLVITQNLCSVCAASHPEVTAAIRHLPKKPQVITLTAQRFDQVLTEIKRLGKLTGRRKQAEQLLGKLQKRLDRIEQKLNGTSHKPRVWCCEWMEPLMAAGHWVPEMVERAGGTDTLGTAGANSVWLNWEKIRSYDPEVIFVMPCSYSIPQTLREKKRLTGRPGWNQLSAVKNKKVFAVSGEFFHHAGPRLVNGVELLAHLLHPDRIPAGTYRSHYRPF